MLEITTHYIDGAFVPATEPARFEVLCSHTEAPVVRSPAGTPAEAEAAIAAAAAAFPTWRAVAPKERAAFVVALGRALEARRDELARAVVREVGMPLKLAERIQLGLPLRTLSVAPALAEALEHEERIGTSLVVREPVGVVGCITPWNYPLHQIAAKVGPALVAGNTVVLKPTELAPTTAFALAEAAHAVGLPPGVLNVVFGDGPTVGEVLARDPRVAMVSFTGSTRAGKRVAELAAGSVKRVALELGGKSAGVVLDDADLPAAVRAVVTSCMLNSGQTCSALTRLVVPRARLAEAEALAVEALAGFRVGDPFDPETRIGPLASALQRSRVRTLIAAAVEEGARLACGGVEAPEGLETGYYVRPTVVADVRPGMRIEQDEVFGPVLCLLAHDGDDDAVAIANDTVYGLSGAVYSSDRARAIAVARRMDTGQVSIGEVPHNPDAPFGGFKQSGIGREYGPHGLFEFTELKAIHLRP